MKKRKRKKKKKGKDKKKTKKQHVKQQSELEWKKNVDINTNEINLGRLIGNSVFKRECNLIECIYTKTFDLNKDHGNDMSKKFNICVCCYIGGKMHKKIEGIKVCSGFQVCCIKRLIQNKEGIPAEQQMLMYGGKILNDWDCLSDHNIQANSTILFSLKPRRN